MNDLRMHVLIGLVVLLCILVNGVSYGAIHAYI